MTDMTLGAGILGYRGNIGEIPGNPKIQQKSYFGTIWQLRGSGGVQNTPTGSLNDFPTRQSQFREVRVSDFSTGPSPISKKVRLVLRVLSTRSVKYIPPYAWILNGFTIWL